MAVQLLSEWQLRGNQFLALKLKEIWSIRVRLELSHRVRDLALFNLALDSKLRGCEVIPPEKDCINK
jgi:hypothetical protein